MNLTEKDIELIEQYLDNTLDQTSKVAFESRLEQDEAFKNAFEQHKTFLKSVEFSLFQKEYNKMERFHEELMQEEIDLEEASTQTEKVDRKTPIIGMRQVLSIAAIFLVGLLAGNFLFPSLQNNPNTFGGNEEGIDLLLQKEIRVKQINLEASNISPQNIMLSLYESNDIESSYEYTNDTLDIFIPALSKRLEDLTDQTPIELLVQSLDSTTTINRLSTLIIDTKPFLIPLDNETINQLFKQ